MMQNNHLTSAGVEQYTGCYLTKHQKITVFIHNPPKIQNKIAAVQNTATRKLKASIQDLNRFKQEK